MPIPNLDNCCGCITDLKVAAAIIAVFGIVTSPIISWAVVRHSYVIRVSCFVTTNAARPDVVDVNINNILTFGFGPNAGLSPSCLSSAAVSPAKTTTAKPVFRAFDSNSDADPSAYVGTVKYIGWLVLIGDIALLSSSATFLVRMFQGGSKPAAKTFMICISVSILISFIYSMLYVSSCIYVGGLFPVFEFIFAFFDLFNVSNALNITGWVFFIFNLVAAWSSFAYLIGIFWSIQLTADVYIICGTISSVISIIYTVLVIMQMYFIKCTNPNDVIILIIYVLLWFYFVIIINSYRDDMSKK